MPEAEVRPAPTARVFFALWPDETVRRALMEVALDLHRLAGGKPVREEAVHMTLLFLGDTPVDRLDTLRAAAGALTFESFTLPIEQAGWWNHNRVVWVGPMQTPPALARLVDALERAVAAQGFRFDRRPFAPHITLVRKARRVPLDLKLPSIEWRVREFVLVRSQLNSDGSRYEVIGRWPPGPEA
jgi:2'-5' RNA ligase